MSWGEVQFKDVATVVTGSTPKKIEGNYDGDIPFVTPGDLGVLAEIDTAKITVTQAGADSARLLPANSVLVCCIGATIGKVGISIIPVVTNQQINSLVFDGNKVFPKYAYYFCATLTPFLRNRSSSTTMPIVNKSSFSEIKIPLPYPDDPEKSLKEQKRIAAILDKADGIRRKRQQAIQLADDFLRSVFLDMFGDPVMNPKGWEVKLLSEVVQSFQNGVGKNKEYYGRGVKVANIGDLYESTSFKPKKFSLLDVTPKEIEKYKLSRGDLLFVRSSVKKEGVAYCSSYDSDELCLFSSFMIRAVINENEVLPKFLSVQLRVPSQRINLVNAANTATITNINQQGLSGINVIVPPIDIQNSFIENQNNVLESVEKMKVQLSFLEDSFNSLSQKAFKGEL